MKVDWICSNCGSKYGTYRAEVSTWHEDKCDVCGKDHVGVTEGRDFGVYSLPASKVEGGK